MTVGYEPQPAWESPQGSSPPPSLPRERRSGWVTTSAIVLLVIGALSALFSLLALLMGALFGSMWTDLMSTVPVEGSGFEGGSLDPGTAEAMGGFMTGFMIGIAIIGVIWSAAHIAAGVGILGARGWARITGIVLAVIGILFSALGLVGVVASIGMSSAMVNDPAFRDIYGSEFTAETMGSALLLNVLMILPFAIGYVIVLVALIRNGRFFERQPGT